MNKLSFNLPSLSSDSVKIALQAYGPYAGVAVATATAGAAVYKLGLVEKVKNFVIDHPALTLGIFAALSYAINRMDGTEVAKTREIVKQSLQGSALADRSKSLAAYLQSCKPLNWIRNPFAIPIKGALL